MHKPFELDRQLLADTLPVGDLPMCRVLLMNDSRYPWLVLVPRRSGLVELDALDRHDRIAVMDDVHCATGALRRACSIDKINLGALGNVVRQLHLHVIGRTHADRAWPAPVWGNGSAIAYPQDAASTRVSTLAGYLAVTRDFRVTEGD
ncbi:HIT family protein [Oleiagrimonas sp.]|jgi:diadenosine tetraphosphate (Ap4A) HIT family hydrolase|uniref:HIT domain-containing protein n=1 Tax=Oleiagrimonas sp. TaxID=2010330 RepID=UPI00260E00F5|nr:HIT family protein [Oleiagrimonas sp.]MDA3913684.1 HIT family protein [Oleiagrimonas sp.]